MLFLRIVQVLESREPYFQQRLDALGRDGFMTIQNGDSATTTTTFVNDIVKGHRNLEEIL